MSRICNCTNAQDGVCCQDRYSQPTNWYKCTTCEGWYPYGPHYCPGPRTLPSYTWIGVRTSTDSVTSDVTESQPFPPSTK
jgi:hypothetical protein